MNRAQYEFWYSVYCLGVEVLAVQQSATWWAEQIWLNEGGIQWHTQLWGIIKFNHDRTWWQYQWKYQKPKLEMYFRSTTFIDRFTISFDTFVSIIAIKYSTLCKHVSCVLRPLTIAYWTYPISLSLILNVGMEPLKHLLCAVYL